MVIFTIIYGGSMGKRKDMQEAARKRGAAMLEEFERDGLTYKELGARHGISATRAGVIINNAKEERKLQNTIQWLNDITK